MRPPPSHWPQSIKNYEIGDQLGHGAFSHVCKATNVDTGATYAVKIFPKANLVGEGDLTRFQREIDTMAYLRHDNLVALHDFLWDDENFYLILDLCLGGELFDYITLHERLDEPTAALLFRQILAGVAYCHSCGVAHRDLKPENVLIVAFPHVKIADFGLCGFLSDSQLMRTFCGSPCYCAPECLSRIRYDGRQSDVWSLGVLLFAMVTGEIPWNLSNASVMLRQILKAAYTIPAHVSPGCRELLQAMIRVIPDTRITIPGIMAHPWMNLADTAVIGQSVPRPVPTVPPPPPLTMRQISEAASQGERQQESGIFSPFEAGTPAGGPRVVIRANSYDQVAIRPVTQRVRPPISIAQSRQRSVTNLWARSKR
jgi:serine/threonine protein kinase